MNFSVLMSVYYKEKADYLKQALDSIFVQTARAGQVVIIEYDPVQESMGHPL